MANSVIEGKQGEIIDIEDQMKEETSENSNSHEKKSEKVEKEEVTE